MNENYFPLFGLPGPKISDSAAHIEFFIIMIIIIRNTYIAPNPTRLAQNASQFKTRMEIRINT